MLKIAVYFNHYNTLGHSTRVFSLIKGLKQHYKAKIRILLLQGGRKQSLIPFYRYGRVHILPHSLGKKGFFIEENRKIYKQMIASSRLTHMLKERIAFIKRALNTFSPDIFITEYYPFGQEFWALEVPHLLEYVKKKFQSRIVSSSGYVSWTENTYEYIKDFYDALFIHSPRELSRDYHRWLHPEGVRQLDAVFTAFSKKINFTGFVLDKPARINRSRMRKDIIRKHYKKIIFVSRGGGIVNDKLLVTSLVVARRNPGLFFVLCCGPATTKEQFTRYTALCKPLANARVFWYLAPREFDRYLQAADACVNMAGYNSTVRLLYFGKKTVFIPYHTTEQTWRAQRMQNFMPAAIIRQNALNASVLEKNLLRLLANRKRPRRRNKKWFQGVPQTVKKLSCMC